MAISQSDYSSLIAAHKGESMFKQLPQQLSELWRKDYLQTFKKAEFLQVTSDAGGGSFTYLFDFARERAVGVWGMPIYNKHKRDASRMKGSPLGAKEDTGYHRGHLIAHSIGGGTDINLVPQLGKVNIGAFRDLEREARNLAEEGVRSFYFIRTIYSSNVSQMPSRIEQVLVRLNGTFTYKSHTNK